MPQGFLLDTNVVSEATRKTPDSNVLRWLDGIDANQLHLSVLSLGELRKGVLLQTDARRRQRLAHWLDTALPAWFGERVLAVELGVALRWAQLLAEAGRPLPAIDSLLAATALHHGLALVTRNERDFGFGGLVVVNPWEAV